MPHFAFPDYIPKPNPPLAIRSDQSRSRDARGALVAVYGCAAGHAEQHEGGGRDAQNGLTGMLTGGYISSLRSGPADSRLNRALCGGRAPVFVHEDLRSPRQIIAADARNTVLWPVWERTGGRLRTAKVGHADRPNRHGRVYPKHVWQDQIDRFRNLLQHGYLTGAVDSVGELAGGNLRDTCIIWRELWMEQDGGVFGRLEIVESHRSGKDLAAVIRAGMKVGFSTFGYGTAHEPSAAERRLYGLADGEPAVVMNPDFRLTKIDATDDPAFEDAFVW